MLSVFKLCLIIWCVVISLFWACAPAQAQQRAILNPSFESNDPQGPGAANFQILSNGQVQGWNATTGEIELWDTNFNSVPSYNGSVHAEMNANVPGALYQTICMINGEQVGWSFAHRARAGGATIQTASFQIATTSGTLVQNLATQSSTINNVWNVNTGSTTYSGPSGLQRVQFTTTNPGSFGNFLDDIRINLNPFVEFNTNASSGVESTATANLPALIVSGTLLTPRTVTVQITGGTATRGADFSTPGGGATFTVNIPAGIYTNTTVPLGIVILNDSIAESSETIQMAILAQTTYTVSNTVSCGGAATASTTYTITDDDSPVVLAKQWTNGIVGNAVSLSITGGALLTAGSSVVGGASTNATAVALAGQTLTLTESYTTGSSANYNTTLECRKNSDNAAVSVTGTGLSRTITMPTGGAVTCTYANTRRSATLTIRKQWTNAIVLDATSVSITGLINNTSLAAVANSTNETDSATAITVYAAESGTISEIWSVGNPLNYNATLACTGNNTPLAGTTLVVNPADTAIVCTFTNSRRSAVLQLRKNWVNGIVNNAVSLPATAGFTNNTVAFASVANTTNETDSGASVTVFSGDVGTIRAETFTAGNAALYQKVLACTGGTLSGTNAFTNNTLMISPSDAGTTIVCTYANVRTTPLTVIKSSTVVADGIRPTDPVAIPGATVRYCILITNPGATSATSVIATDILPLNVVLIAGTMRTGPSCESATMVEDANATGSDESDPFGMSASGSTITATAATLAASGSFAIVFNVIVQ